jgi:ankyrin repeat protein
MLQFRVGFSMVVAGWPMSERQSVRRCWLGAFAIAASIAMSCARSPEEKLLRAAEGGRVSEVERLLAAGVPISSRDGWSSTPMMYAAANCHTDVVRLLASKGADINEHRGVRMGRTPTMWAAQAGCDELVAWFVKAGADPSIRDNDGATAAELALAGGHKSVAALLRVTR